jgi:hypothetical protein
VVVMVAGLWGGWLFVLWQSSGMDGRSSWRRFAGLRCPRLFDGGKFEEE